MNVEKYRSIKSLHFHSPMVCPTYVYGNWRHVPSISGSVELQGHRTRVSDPPCISLAYHFRYFGLCRLRMEPIDNSLSHR
jgi:hypothetical protein